MRRAKSVGADGFLAIQATRNPSYDKRRERKRYLCLSKIKSEHIRGAIRRGLGGKEYAVCTENLIRVDDVLESPKLAE
jgi:hypothetical protein